jgi:hypothetical protein
MIPKQDLKNNEGHRLLLALFYSPLRTRLLLKILCAFVTVVLLFAALSGCASSVIVSVKDKKSGTPLEGTRVDRYRQVSFMQSLLNPVGAFYFPYRFLDSRVTNKKGEITYGESRPKDYYYIYRDNASAVVITVGPLHFDASPRGAGLTATKWKCIISPKEDGVLAKEVFPIDEWDSPGRHQ